MVDFFSKFRDHHFLNPGKKLTSKLISKCSDLLSYSRSFYHWFLVQLLATPQPMGIRYHLYAAQPQRDRLAIQLQGSFSKTLFPSAYSMSTTLVLP